MEFSIDSSGRGQFLFFTAGTGIDARNTTINGVTYNFKASKQDDGTWIIEAAGGDAPTPSTPTATPSQTTTHTPNSDRSALVALYNASGGPNWHNNTNWLSDKPLHEWHGVTTDVNGRVLELRLEKNQLTGPIPPQLGSLASLERLLLSRNQLTGPIPHELGSLANLEWLYLEANRLTGPIPLELVSLANLRRLVLEGNRLTGPIPPQLGSLANLETVMLWNNQLTGPIPHELGSLANLERLRLSRNQLTGCIPQGLADVEYNDIDSLRLDICEAAGGGITASSTPTPTPTPTVVSIDVTAMTALKSIGETAQFSVIAKMSDGSSHGVESGLVQWESSDPRVAAVSEGTVAAVGAGNATLTASYGGVEAAVQVSVRISERGPGTVRVLYASPSDREFQADYSEAVSHAIVDIQSWYRRQLGGLTFSLYDATPEWCQMSEPADFYAVGHAWNKVLAGVQHCAPVTSGPSDFVWVIYPEVVEDCDEYHRLGEDGHELGRGGLGLTMVPDLEGLTNPGRPYYFCGEGPYVGSLGRWIGGLGHELAHAFGLPHPPGCDPWDPAKCDHQEASSLMHDGYWLYPETHLLPSDKETLMRSPFFDGEPTLDGDWLDTLSGPTIRGAALGPDGESSEGLWVSLIADTFWSWGETERDGTFDIRLPEGSSGSSILSIHSGDLGDCGWRGYYGSGGFTTQRNRATKVEIAGANVTGIEIRLPVRADQLCNRQSASTIRGIMTTPDGQPVEGVWLWVVGAEDLGTFTDSRGEFSIEAPDGSYGLLLDLGDRIVGWYDEKGITADPSEAAALEVAGWDVEGVEIRLPARPEDLPCVAWC